MCCTWLTGNTACKNDTKNYYLCTTAQLCQAISSQLRHVSTIGKKSLLNSYMSSTCPHNTANLRLINGWDLLASSGHPSKFNRFRVLPSLLQRCHSLEANQTLHDVWPSPGLLHYIYIFGGCCPLTEFCPVQNSLYIQVLRSCLLAALLHGTPAAGISQTLRHGTRNGIIELSQRAPPIFGGAVMTLGIGPHSSCIMLSHRDMHTFACSVKWNVCVRNVSNIWRVRETEVSDWMDLWKNVLQPRCETSGKIPQSVVGYFDWWSAEC